MQASSKADLYLILVTLMAAISWMFSHEALQLMPPLLFIGTRFLMAGLLLAAIGHASLRQLSFYQWRRGLSVGLVFGMAMSCWIMGLKNATHVGEGAFLTSLAVVLVPVMGRLFFAESAPASTWLALPVAVTGLALLAVPGGMNLAPWQLYFIGAASLFAFYYNLNTRAANHGRVRGRDGLWQDIERIPAVALTSLALLAVGALALTLSLLLEQPDIRATQLGWPLVGWVTASALIGTAGRFLLQTHAQSLSTHSHGVVIMVVEPVWTAVIAALWIGESMAPIQFAGCGLIFAALLVTRWRALRTLLKAAMG